jgi:hypothetical protein
MYVLSVHLYIRADVCCRNRLNLSGSIRNYILIFRQLASKNGFIVTAAFEKFMASAIDYGLVFPSAVKVVNVEDEARVFLSWLKEGRYWINLGGGEETSTRGRLLKLLFDIEDVDLRLDLEETLKKKP